MNGTTLTASQLQLLTITSCFNNNKEIIFDKKSSSFHSSNSILTTNPKHHISSVPEVYEKINAFIQAQKEKYNNRKQLSKLKEVLEGRLKKIEASTTGFWAMICRYSYIYADQMKSMDQQKSHLENLSQSVENSLNKIKTMKKEASVSCVNFADQHTPVTSSPYSSNSLGTPLQSTLGKKLFEQKLITREPSSLRIELTSMNQSDNFNPIPPIASRPAPPLPPPQNIPDLPQPQNIDGKLPLLGISTVQKIDKPQPPLYQTNFKQLSSDDLKSDIKKMDEHIINLSNLVTPFISAMNAFNKLNENIIETKDKLDCFTSELKKVTSCLNECLMIKKKIEDCSNQEQDLLLNIKDSGNKFPIFCQKSLEEIKKFYNIEETQDFHRNGDSSNTTDEDEWGSSPISVKPTIACTPQDKRSIQNTFSNHLHSNTPFRNTKSEEIPIILLNHASALKIEKDCSDFINIFEIQQKDISNNISNLTKQLLAEKSDLTNLETSTDFHNGHSFQAVKRFIESIEAEIAKFTRFKTSREQHLNHTVSKSNKQATNQVIKSSESNPNHTQKTLSKTLRDLLDYLRKLPQQFEIALIGKKSDPLALHDKNEIDAGTAVNLFKQHYLHYFDI